MIYFDNAATTPLDAEVSDHVKHTMDTCFGNPSSIHAIGRQSKVVVEESRIQIASLIDAAPSEIYFTSSATEAITTAIYGAVLDLGIRHIIFSPTEHHAVMHAIDAVSKIKNIKRTSLPIDNNGSVDTEALSACLQNFSNSMVIVMSANNETGKINDVAQISSICQEYKALYVCDMVQVFGKYPISLNALNPSFAACSAHKFHGPKGIGFLYISGETKISALISGGGQERNMRSGTENVYGIAGMAKAFEIAYRDMAKNSAHIKQLKNYFVDGLKEKFESIQFHANSDIEGLYNLVSLRFSNSKINEMLVQNLDIKGIAVSGGSACSSGTVGGSHVLEAMGMPAGSNAIRFSFSKYNTVAEIDIVLHKLEEIIQR